MNLNLNDKHILITGGSKGIGLACALAFLQEGARVTLVARQADTLAAASAKLLQAVPGASVYTVSADLMDADKAAAALTQAQSQIRKRCIGIYLSTLWRSPSLYEKHS